MSRDKSSSEKGEGEKSKSKREKTKAPTKLVIRHLPPTMIETEFKEQVAPIADYDYFYFCEADWSLGSEATCRAHISFKNLEDVYSFVDRFDGYVFVDTKGAEYIAIVEFSPFQGFVKSRSRGRDNKVNTIDSEPHYQQFLIKLKEDEEASAKRGESKLEFTLDRKKDDRLKSTPLLQYLAQKKEKRREDQKKRIEEKRKQRDEERNYQSQVTLKSRAKEKNSDERDKAINNQETGKKNNKCNDKQDKNKNNNADQRSGTNNKEEHKNSRSKRRIERSLRRQEAYHRRVRDEKENISKLKIATNPEHAKKHEDSVEKQQHNEKQSDKKVDTKEGKNDEQRKVGKNVDDIPVKDSKSEDVLTALVENMKTVSLDVKTDTDVDKIVKIHEIIETTKNTSGGDSGTKPKQTSLTQKQSAAEERRIRNKDRPSIAIYQPKIRSRDGTDSKNGKNNASNDCESYKKEEPRVKKVSRYSERRNERRAKQEKQQSTETRSNNEAEPSPVPFEGKNNENSIETVDNSNET
ncbi:regulator of nonsense transcripts 3B-like [Teleopsis dalmanni]|uniref:regulator of nonsense transcripts 3B-like n=1 Tax=Teleopsis dalmanni TaxID=139649 RepID=UPI000D329971|nr:regulator of nonsense transcripts 3B-like [Teleopsis dalmanni]